MKHYTKRPKDIHVPCETKGCNNYFNMYYKNANGYCKICNEKKFEYQVKHHPLATGFMQKDIKSRGEK